MARKRRHLGLGALCTLLIALASAPAALAAAPIALGVNVERAPDDAAQLSRYVNAAGRAPALVMWYQSWSEPLLYSNQIAHVDAVGSEPLITWSPSLSRGGVPLAAIADGSWDAYIRRQARLAVAYRRPMMIRFAHEMNLPGSVYGPAVNGNTPARFVAAWRHVVSIFRAEGASNVSWVWSPNVHCDGRCPFTDFYPGDAWTDWVALDGYNYGSTDNMPWMSLASVFKPSYDILTGITNKPVMIAETASTERGGDKAAWIRDGLLHAVPETMPRVRAVVWFDRMKETDWRVDSSSRTLAAWRDVVDSPLYGAPRATSLRMAGASARGSAPRRTCRAAVLAHGGRKISRKARNRRVAACVRRRTRPARSTRKALVGLGGSGAVRFGV